MKTSSLVKYSMPALFLLLAACGGGGGGGGNGGTTGGTGTTGATSATSFINWTWVNGSDTSFQFGDYGVKGTSAPTNQPRALEGAASWNDNSGNLWLFGGGGIDIAPPSPSGDFNDLWKFNTSTKLWTWVSGSSALNQLGTYGTQGTASPTNVPGSRQYSSTWTDASGNLWLFGGYVRVDAAGATSYANDMWKYDTTTNQWAWMSGSDVIDQPGSYGTIHVADPTNAPGARKESVAWNVNGSLWLFGGLGYDSAGNLGYLNDLWKYDTTTNQWTWVSGSKTIASSSNYGAKGVINSTNVPGGRLGAVAWKDVSNNLWMFGGYSSDGVISISFNDLWKYDSTTNQWTWMSGANTANQSGNYGTAGIASPSNVPGARRSAVSWTDSNGKFWLLGGSRYDASFNTEEFNDLWKYDTTTNQWTWMSGSNVVNQHGTYGTLGGPAALDNVPGARDVAVSWTDSNGKFWLFGGQGNDSLGSVGYLNDLWSFVVK